jgi:hypothetical protein
MLAAAHVGLGVGIGRAWALLVPAVLSIAWLAASGAEGLAYLILILGAPAPVGLTAIGWALGKGPRRLRDGTAIACVAGVVLVFAVGVAAEPRRGPHVPASVQRQLPTNVSFGNLCPDASTPKELEREIQRKADVLLRELDAHPHHTVTRTVYYSDGGGEDTEEITIRQLTEEQLSDLETGGPGCDPQLKRRLCAAF